MDAAAAIRDVETLLGDGSSAVVLRRAGIVGADALIAASDDDEANLEAVRIANETGLLRVVAVAVDPERLDDYRSLDVEVFAPDRLTARHVEVQLEPRRVSSTAFAQGKAEAIEFVVSPDSPVRGKRLRELHSKTWVVAAVLRDGQLIIPEGSTRFEAHDRVTVVGAAADYAGIVNTFTSGESRFPLSFGRKVIVVLDTARDLDIAVAEAVHLVQNSQADELTVVHRDLAKERDLGKVDEIEELIEKLRAGPNGVEIDFRPVPGDPNEALRALVEDESVGVVVVSAPEGGNLMRRIRVSRTVNAFGKSRVPVLISRTRHPYSGILVPARRTVSGEAAGRAAIDLARILGSTLIGISVVPAAFVSGPEAVEDARLAAAWLREEAAVQGVPVQRRIRRGNPVRVIDELSNATSLLVLSMPSLPIAPWRLGIAGHLIHRVAGSVLLVPGGS